MGNKVECIQQANAILGEGPVWDWRSGDVLWVDIRRGHVFRHNLRSGRQTGQWAFRERVGFVALTGHPGRVIVGSGTTIHVLTLADGSTRAIADVGFGRQRHRVNDAAVDRRGRLWIGTMRDDFFAPDAFVDGQLYRLDPDGTVTGFGEYQLPNGIGWSPDGTRMYINDSAARRTYVRPFDEASGVAGEQQVLYAPSSDDEGLPDGLSVDAGGNVWSAMWDGWRIIRLAPDGRLLERHDMPVRRASSATFGGEDLDQLIITSATVDFTSADFLLSPQAGGLFRMPAGCTGQRANLFTLV